MILVVVVTTMSMTMIDIRGFTEADIGRNKGVSSSVPALIGVHSEKG